MWRGNRKDQVQIWQVFPKKDISGGCQSFPHCPRSVPTNFDFKSEPELIQGNVSRAEPLPSGSYRNISVPVQKLVQRRQGRGVRSTTKPLAGGYELLLTHQEHSGSGEDHKALGRMDSIVWKR
ncbi:hypothetical protein O181_027514 [Austropuccinia psidii MF-1]|uniref:Uncharacterized protein n=1 Tax=Austropuccinia psidii MF-1 TaxID=1389203 RepID=A0A9Q3CM56_9BASI|nr:hypothetical protein [Austropuccinia psidii MF-1]